MDQALTDRYRQLTRQIDEAQTTLADERSQVVRDLLVGHTQQEVADELGITRSRVSQLASRPSRGT